MDMLRFSGGREDVGEEITPPSTSIVPDEGLMKPAIMRSVVVLPQPDGPSSDTNSPSRNSRLKSLTAEYSPKRLVTLCRASLLMPLSSAA